ncbi:MAG: hypothetical protein ACTS3R_17785 [Inquilinaceae bacterium]
MHDNPAFDASCTDVRTHGFRDETNIVGERRTKDWTVTEMFNSTWTFRYRSGGVIVVEGRGIPIVATLPGVIIAVDRAAGDFGASVWSYAINLHLKSITAAQVNGNVMIGETFKQVGVKSRVIELDCAFTF